MNRHLITSSFASPRTVVAPWAYHLRYAQAVTLDLSSSRDCLVRLHMRFELAEISRLLHRVEQSVAGLLRQHHPIVAVIRNLPLHLN